MSSELETLKTELESLRAENQELRQKLAESEAASVEAMEERMICYGDGATFVPKCPVCNRYVKPYKRVKFDFEGQPRGPNGKCKTHGKIQMLWQGYY